MLPVIQNYPLFLLAALVLLVTPGPAVMYIIARSVDQGTRAGLASAAGAALGSLIQVIAAAVGLAALLVAYPAAFTLLKLAGGGYLVFLGLQKLWNARKGFQAVKAEPQPLPAIYRQAILVNVLNPKTTLFFFAFLPQFITPNQGSVPVQILFLGGSFVALGLCTDSSYALLSGWISGRLRKNPGSQVIGNIAAGIVYILLGILAVLSK